MSVPFVRQSALVPTSAGKVWDAVRALDFKFWSLVESSKVDHGTEPLSPIVTVAFKDGTVQKLRVVAFSTLERSLTYEVIESQPAVSYSSAQYTLRVDEVTATGQAFVSFDASFSSDASAEVVQDAKFKRADALQELSAFFAK